MSVAITGQRLLPALVLVLASSPVAAGSQPAPSRTVEVCPTGATEPGCDFIGDNALQQAVDHAGDGAHIHLHRGRYTPRSYHDVAFQGLTIRGYVLVRDKSLTIVGEPGAVLDGSQGAHTSALVVDHGHLDISGVTMRGFRAELPEDDIYDGHGVFVIDGNARIENVTFRHIEKMAVTARGNSDVRIVDSRILDGHLGIWTEENARVRLEHSLLRGNNSAGIAAYARSRAIIDDCVFDGNADDGAYAAEHAHMQIRDSLFVHNAPYAVRGVDQSTFETRASFFYANAAVSNTGDSASPEIVGGLRMDAAAPACGETGGQPPQVCRGE